MPDLKFSLTTWGSPASEKRVLLLHGLMGTGTVWFKVAEKLAMAGYVGLDLHAAWERVDAPDLLGHGWAPHVPSYTIPILAQHLADNLTEPYDLIGGVSFGSTIVAALYPLLKHKPRRIVLAEPLFDHPAPPDDQIQGMVNGTKEIPSEETLLKTFPKWIPEEAILRRLSLNQMDPEAIIQLFDEVKKGNLNHGLLPSQDSSSGTEIIILGADPELRGIYPARNATVLEEKYPHVKLAIRPGATHDMHKDKPDVVAGVLLGGLEDPAQFGLEVLRG